MLREHADSGRLVDARPHVTRSAPVRIEPVEDRGTLIILTPERFTVANPEHVALARRVRERLTRAGLMMLVPGEKW